MTGNVKAVSTIMACLTHLPLAGGGAQQAAKFHQVSDGLRGGGDTCDTGPPQHPNGTLNRPSAPKWPQGLLRDSLVHFLGSGLPGWGADSS
jgi:hypothetical protein